MSGEGHEALQAPAAVVRREENQPKALGATPHAAARRFKHSGAARRLGFHARHPRVLPALCKLLAIPVLIFGPGLGIPATILAYGVMTRSSVLDAMTLRKWSAWVSSSCLFGSLPLPHRPPCPPHPHGGSALRSRRV